MGADVGDPVQTDVSLEALISSAAFVVDVRDMAQIQEALHINICIHKIIVDAKGEVQQANVSYTPEAKEEEAVTREQVNKELDGLLRQRMPSLFFLKQCITLLLEQSWGYGNDRKEAKEAERASSVVSGQS